MVSVPTLGDVARLAGVHPATASRALNDGTRGMVAVDTVKRVVEAAESLGYTPNVVARGLRRRVSQTIGVLVPDLTNALFPPIVRGIEAALAPRGFTAFTSNTDNDDAIEKRAFGALRARQVDGFIFATARREHPLVREVHDAGIPAVLVNRTTDEEFFSSVAVDEDSGVRQIVDHLVELGHRRIAHIAGPQDSSSGFQRRRSFLSQIKKRGLKVADCPVLIAEAFDLDSGASLTRVVLHEFPGVTALVCANDMMAIGALDVLREAGLRCPDDMSVVGYNDMPLAQYLAPSLTTVRVPTLQLGSIAASLLLDVISGDATRRSVLLPAELQIRASSAIPPAAAP